MNKLDFNHVQQFSNVLEALLLAAGKPLSLERIADLFDTDMQPSTAQIKAALEQLDADSKGRSYQLTEVASGFRLQVRPEYSPWVGRLWEERPQRYSRATLETLALIAYRQPITRGEIEDVRGVAVSAQLIKTLLEREWIRVVGYKDVPGKPAMLATTKAFLDYFNLRTLDELPNHSELQELQAVANDPTEQEAVVATVQTVVSDAASESMNNASRVSFSSLLGELESMESGLKTDYVDNTMDVDNNVLDVITDENQPI
ncbi:MAG TPA: SMC-Scp complex subunit ScpB [Thiopseudomonas sp.]|nr:SMC-Scp complex subunit ScpB [Thiopseudomonas sp.]